MFQIKGYVLPFTHIDGYLRAFCHYDEPFSPYGPFRWLCQQSNKPAFPGPWFSREVKNHCGALCYILVVRNTIWTDSYIMSTMTCVSLTQVNETELPTPNLNKNQVGRTDWSTLSWFQVFHWEKKSGAPWNSSVIRIYSCVSSWAFLDHNLAHNAVSWFLFECFVIYHSVVLYVERK